MKLQSLIFSYYEKQMFACWKNVFILRVVCMSLYVYACTYVYVFVSMYVYANIYVCLYMFVCVFVHVYVCVYMHVPVCVGVYVCVCNYLESIMITLLYIIQELTDKPK